jgi:hypothetical protein
MSETETQPTPEPEQPAPAPEPEGVTSHEPIREGIEKLTGHEGADDDTTSTA